MAASPDPKAFGDIKIIIKADREAYRGPVEARFVTAVQRDDLPSRPAQPPPERVPPRPANSAAVCKLEQALACDAGLRAQVAEALIALSVNVWQRGPGIMPSGDRAEERWAQHLIDQSGADTEVYT